MLFVLGFLLAFFFFVVCFLFFLFFKDEQDACSGVHTGLRMRRYVLLCNIHGSGGQESS